MTWVKLVESCAEPGCLAGLSHVDGAAPHYSRPNRKPGCSWCRSIARRLRLRSDLQGVAVDLLTTRESCVRSVMSYVCLCLLHTHAADCTRDHQALYLGSAFEDRVDLG